MAEDQLQLSRDGAILTMTLHRPEVRNALSKRLLLDLEEAVAGAAADSSLHVIVVTGGGAFFSAGDDLNELGTLTQPEVEVYSRLGQRVLTALEACPQVVIAAVAGYAFGGGLELALACDLRSAGEGARLGFPEVGLGNIPGFGGIRRLRELAGLGAARRLLYTGRSVMAEEAFRLGLVDLVVPDRELLPETHVWAERIARHAPLALRACKQLLAECEGLSRAEAWSREQKLFVRLFASEDAREGLEAHKEKRLPRFMGR